MSRIMPYVRRHPGLAGGFRVGARVRLLPGSPQRGCLRGGAVGTLLEDDGSDVPYKCERGGQTYWYAARDIIAADDPGAAPRKVYTLSGGGQRDHPFRKGQKVERRDGGDAWA